MMVLSCFDTRRSASFTAARSAPHCHLSRLSRGKQGSLPFVLQRLQLAFSPRAKADGLQTLGSLGSCEKHQLYCLE